MRRTTLFSKAKRLAYLGTLAMGLVIALASCEGEKPKPATTTTTYWGSYSVDSIVADVAGKYVAGKYTGTIKIEDASAIGGTVEVDTITKKRVPVNATVTFGKGEAKIGDYPASSIDEDLITSGELANDTFTGLGLTLTLGKLSDTRISIKSSTKALGAPVDFSVTFYLTKK